MLFLLALFACQSDSETEPTTTSTSTSTSTTDERFRDFVAALESDLASSEALGVSAAIYEEGEVVFSIALGQARHDDSKPVSTSTLFQTGSITKMLTATATLQAVESGRLKLEDTLADAYPNSEFAFDNSWNDSITMHHLLSHQGAFYDYIDMAASTDDADLAGWHEEIFFPYLWLMAPPGTFYNYSNPNFDVAGLVVEALDNGRYFPDIMAEDLFQPLGMDRTTMRLAEAITDGDYAESIGYTYDAAGNANYGDVAIENVLDLAHARPAGAGTWTTPEQLLSFAHFLLEGDAAVLEDGLRGLLYTPHVPLGYGFDETHYGYGLFVAPGYFTSETEYIEIPFWQHNGLTNSYSADMGILPEQKFAYTILTSGYGTNFSASAVAALALASDLPAPTAGPSYTFDPDRLDAHVGTYGDPFNVGDMVITREGDGLMIEMPLLTNKYGYNVNPNLYAMSSDVFYLDLDGVYYDLTFFSDDDPDSSRWVRNRYFVGDKSLSEESTSAASRAEVDEMLRRARVPAHQFWAPNVEALSRRP
jgi:CubicO group peptidase (beta-lactamase class C family)